MMQQVELLSQSSSKLISQRYSVKVIYSSQLTLVDRCSGNQGKLMDKKKTKYYNHLASRAASLTLL